MSIYEYTEHATSYAYLLGKGYKHRIMNKMDVSGNFVHIPTDRLNTQVGKYEAQLQMSTEHKGISAYCEVRGWVTEELWLSLR